MLQIYTSIAANYIPKARALAHSVKEHIPDATMHLLLVDDVPEGFSLEDEPFDALITLDMLDIDLVRPWMFGHKIVEACTAVKPFALRYLLSLEETSEVIYFDPDIVVFHPITPLIEAFADHSILLTPHINQPEATLDAIKDNEINSLKHGLFNFGFVGVKKDATGIAYANWWAERCYHWCIDDIAGGLFTDQKWNDHVPVFFDYVGILKHPGLNVATWNYAQRTLEGSLDAGITVNGEPLIFHHFTGYDSGAHHIMRDKYGGDMPAALELSRWYESTLADAEQDALSTIPWGFGAYDNGDTVRPAHRALYRTRQDLRDAFADPFSTTASGKHHSSYHAWLHAEGLFDSEFTVNETPLPFSQFLQQTHARFSQYIRGTHRLSAWQKRGSVMAVNAIFSLLNLPYKWLKDAR